MKRIFQTATAAIHAFFMPGDFDACGGQIPDPDIEEIKEARQVSLIVAVAVSTAVLAFIAALGLAGRI